MQQLANINPLQQIMKHGISVGSLQQASEDSSKRVNTDPNSKSIVKHDYSSIKNSITNHQNYLKLSNNSFHRGSPHLNPSQVNSQALRCSNGSQSKPGSFGGNTDTIMGDTIDCNEINEGVVYTEGGVGKQNKSPHHRMPPPKQPCNNQDPYHQYLIQ